MVEDSLTSIKTTPSDRRVDQAILALKKGAQLLKYRQRGKPKFCPFRLSTDERLLIWYSAKDEKHLKLNSITKIIPGTVNFQRQPEPGKECQSFSIIYENGERSLDLVCKDKEQAESWLIGLRDLVSRSHLDRPFSSLRSWRSAKSCINSPVGYSRRKQTLGLSRDTTKISQVRSLCGSPPRLTAEQSIPDSLSCSSGSLYSSRRGGFSLIQTVRDVVTPHISFQESEDFDEDWCADPGLPTIEKTDVLKDVLMWGEGVEGGKLRGGDRSTAPNGTLRDALLPKLLDSIALLDVKDISLGAKHAALVTRQGEVFCWGEENGGRLGHMSTINLPHPKLVDSLNEVHINSVSCGEYQTYALTRDGDIYTWGSGISAGQGDLPNRYQWLPRKLSGPFNDIHVSSVSCGEWHTAVVSSSGQLFTYGDGTFGALGHGNTQSLSQAKEVESLKGLIVKSVACGSWHTAAIIDAMGTYASDNTFSGKLFTWGDGDKRKLGHVDQEKKLLPICISELVDHDFIQVSCGRTLTVGLTSTGTVYTMGSAENGQLGNPHAEDKSIAVVEGDLKGEFVKKISSGSYHIAALTSRGTVYTWGKGANGQLGLGDILDRNSPTLLEALTDRKVESVACGSNFTAAICLHKSIFSTDQSGCNGCKMVFGFTRKKHNCYNCGFLFCRACSSKKVMNASLAPNKSKPFNVCDTCFTKLTEDTCSNGSKKYEEPYPNSKPSSISKNTLSNLRIDRGEAVLPYGSLISPRLFNYDETKFFGGKVSDKEERNQQNPDHALPLSSIPRWGKVECPMAFYTTHLSEAAVSKVYPSAENLLRVPKSIHLSEPDKMLAEELKRLQVEAKSLEQQCQIKSERLQKYQERIDETWALAREEAAKCKAAKEIIKALTIRLYALSEKHSDIKTENIITKPTEGLDVYLPQITPICTDASALDSVDPSLFTARITPEGAVPNYMQVHAKCTSPIPFRATISDAQGREHCEGIGGLSDPPVSAEAVSDQNVPRTLRSEWVEQDEPGVYITFTNLPSGQRGLKRVRFSRKRFSEREAERWWEENQTRIYKKYNIEGIHSQNKSKRRGS